MFKEYLSRENVNSAIKGWVSSGEWRRRDSIDCLRRRMCDVPFENVGPIVFCKDCKFRGGECSKEECRLRTVRAGMRRIWVKTKPYDYCNYGKRRQ